MNFGQLIPLIRQNKLLFFFLFAMLLLKIYPFYLLPIQNVIFSSHTLVKLIVIFTTIALFLGNYNKTVEIITKNKLLFILLFAFFLGQTASIIPAKDIALFLKFYHNTVLSIFIFLFSFILCLKRKNTPRVVFYFIVMTGTAIVLSELIFRIFNDSLLPFFIAVFQKEIVDTFLSNKAQNKYVLALAGELFLPFFLFLIFNQKTKLKTKVFFIFISTILIFLSILSNFRTRTLSAAFCLFAFMLVFFIKNASNYFRSSVIPKVFGIFIIISFFSLVFYSAINISDSLYSFNVIDRFVLQDKSEDLGTLNLRVDQMNNSVDLYRYSPLLGVGLGNYSNFINKEFRASPLTTSYELDFIRMSKARPHSIIFQLLGETGIIGLTTFSVLVLYFIFQDIKYLMWKKPNFILSYIISSWSVMIYALLNPADTIYVTGWFWFLRGVIAALEKTTLFY